MGTEQDLYRRFSLGTVRNLFVKQYFGEIKNELFFKNEARNFTFRTTSPIWLDDGSGESFGR